MEPRARKLAGQQWEDLVNDTVVRVLRRGDLFRADGEPFAAERWFYTVMRNTFIDGVRRERVRRHSGAPAEPIYHHPDSVVYDELVQMIMELPDGMREASVLVLIEGREYEEAANLLGVRPGTVNSRVHRARAILRKKLE